MYNIIATVIENLMSDVIKNIKAPGIYHNKHCMEKHPFVSTLITSQS